MNKENVKEGHIGHTDSGEPEKNHLTEGEMA